MIISNEQSTREVGLWFSLIITFLTVVFLTSILVEPIQVWWIQYPSAALTLLTILVFRFGGFHYISTSLANQEIEIKFYNIFPYGRKFRMIKTSAKQLQRIVIRKGFLGIGRGMILYQQTGNQVAKYPFIGLSALNENDRTRILIHLKNKPIMG